MAWVSPSSSYKGPYQSNVRYPVISTDDEWITFNSLGIYHKYDKIPWSHIGKGWVYNKEEDIIDALLEKYA